MEDNIQDMQMTLKPTKDEIKWVRSPYNWGGAVLLIQFIFIFVTVNLVVFVAASYVRMQPDITKEVYDEFIKGLKGLSFTAVLANLIGAVIAYPIAIMIGCKGLKVKARSFFSTKGYDTKFVLLAIIVALGAQVVGTYLANFVTWICDLYGVTLTTLDTSIKPDMATNIMMYVLACVSAPLFEEMIFRGLILKAFSRVSIRFGIIASAAMFGLFHQNIPQAINAFLLGLVFGYVAYKAGSIVPTIILHFALNANAMIQEAVTYYLSDYSEQIGLIWTILVVLGTVAVLYFNRNKFALPKDTKTIKKRTFPLFATSWTIIIIVLADVAATILSIEIQ